MIRRAPARPALPHGTPAARISGAVLLLLFLTFVAPAGAQQAGRRLVVDNAGSGQFSTIAAALEQSAAGDTIVLRTGSSPYAGPAALKSGQSIVGEGSPVITAESGSVVTISGDASLTNVAIRAAGTANGISIRDAGTVTLRDVTITTTAGAGLVANKVTKLVIGGASTIAAVGGAAVDLSASELDVVLTSASARGEKLTGGIVLEKTTGRFTIEGKNGEPGSGGTIEGASRRAITAVDATNVTFRWMHLARNAHASGVAGKDCGGDLHGGRNDQCHAAAYFRGVAGATLDGVIVDGSGQAGVVAHRVSDLSLLNTEIRNAGDELAEHGVIAQELTGTCRIAASKIRNSASRQVMLHNSRGKLTLVLQGSTFSDSAAPHGQQGVLVTAAKNATIDVQVRDSVFARNFSHGLNVLAGDEAKVSLSVTGSSFDRNSGAIAIAATHAATIDYAIADNPSIVNAGSAAINIYLGTPSRGRVSGTIARNTIVKSGVTLNANGDGFVVAAVTGNTIRQFEGSAIQATAGQGSAALDVTVSGNTIREPAGTNAAAVRITAGTLPTDSAKVCADVRTNKIAGAFDPNGAIHVVHRYGGTRFRLAGLTGGNTDAAAAAFLAARNGDVKVRAALRPDSQARGFESAARCTIPTLTK